MLKQLRIYNKTYEIQDGDCIKFRDEKYYLHSGDNRTLTINNDKFYPWVEIPRKLIEKIDLSKLKKVGNNYYFKK